MASTAARTALTAAASLAALGGMAACGGGTVATRTLDDEAPAQAADADTTTGTGASSSADAGQNAGQDSVAETRALDSGADQDATAENDSADSGASDATSAYADGSYDAVGTYVSPGGQQHIEISLTLAGGIVTQVLATPAASDPNSTSYQTKFASGLADVVVGRPIDELEVDKVAGSSLTSRGFADAIDQIKDEARA